MSQALIDAGAPESGPAGEVVPAEERRAVDSYRPRALADPFEEPPPGNLGSPMGFITFGLWVILIAFGGFGTWAATAPLSSAAIAPGILAVENKRKTVQHLEGGIISAIHVREGDEVAKGDVLLELEPVRAETNLNQVEAEYVVQLARRDRLVAERDGAEDIAFTPYLKERAGDPTVASHIDNQAALFRSRRRNLFGQLTVLDEQIARSVEEANGLASRINAEERSLALLREEVRAVKTLFDQGLTPRNRLLAVQREETLISGRVQELQATAAASRRRVAELEQEKLNLVQQYEREVFEDLERVQLSIEDLEIRRTAAEDVVSRIAIRAPEAGEVTGLQVVSTGQVISPGETLMELVPEDNLIVEALLKPTDIDVVREGMDARIRLSAFNFRTAPPVDARVIHVSADRVTDERSRTSAYLVQLEFTQSFEEPPLDALELFPGMDAEVMILLGERTLVDYMAQPILDTLNRGFREE